MRFSSHNLSSQFVFSGRMWWTDRSILLSRPLVPARLLKQATHRYLSRFRICSRFSFHSYDQRKISSLLGELREGYLFSGRFSQTYFLSCIFPQYGQAFFILSPLVTAKPLLLERLGCGIYQRAMLGERSRRRELQAAHKLPKRWNFGYQIKQESDSRRETQKA